MWTSQATALGVAAPSAAVSGRVYLTPQGGLGALQQFAVSVSTPSSPDYHHFLTSGQYQARFAPSGTSAGALNGYLHAFGLTVTAVGAQHRFISFTGTVAQADRAFGTTIQRYVHNGVTVQAPSTTLSMPADIAQDVLAIDGLDTSAHVARTPVASADRLPGGFRNARPCSTYFGQVAATYQADFTTPLPKFAGQRPYYAPCGYNGTQLRAAYEGNSRFDGAGITVAVVGAYASTTTFSDVQHYAADNGDRPYQPGQLTRSLAPQFRFKAVCDATDWASEEIGDVESVHAMAQGATIRYYGAASCSDPDLLDADAQVAIDDTAQIVTNSWGSGEEASDSAIIAAYEQVFLQGAAEGISYIYSSGDWGDEIALTGIKQVEYPASDPYVTSVGGTSTEIGITGQLIGQTGWGTQKYVLSPNGKRWLPLGFTLGSGGGFSTLFNQPSYQTGVVSGSSRGVPDVSMDGDPATGALVGQTQVFPDGTYYAEYRSGGTSLSAPLFAGLTALSLQKAGTSGGLLNPVIYANRHDFSDVSGSPNTPGVVRADFVNGVDSSEGLVYSVRTFDQDTTLAVAPGWDDVTGLGTGTSRWIDALAVN